MAQGFQLEIIQGTLVTLASRPKRLHVVLAPASQGDTPSAIAAAIGRETADLTAILFRLLLRPHVRAMYEAEIQDEVAAIFGDADLDPAEAENCRLVAWLAFDRRLALHACNHRMGGRA
jgi:hypothetical protein